jgi:hypothetical protein
MARPGIMTALPSKLAGSMKRPQRRSFAPFDGILMTENERNQMSGARQTVPGPAVLVALLTIFACFGALIVMLGWFALFRI